MESVLDYLILFFMAATVIAIVRLKNLLAVVMLSSLYSLLAASIFVVLDAVDVAFTEASVGAGISTVLMLGTLAITTRHEKEARRTRWPALLIVVVTGAALIYGVGGLPPYGDAAAPANHHVVPRYLSESLPATSVPNVVTAVLASYRGYDTLGETTVIFTAGIGVILLMGSWRRRLAAREKP